MDGKWYNMTNWWDNYTQINASGEGLHTLIIYANDTLGNVNVTSLNFTVDLVPLLNIVPDTEVTFEIGNWSRVYTITLNITPIGNASGVNVTFYLPYGIENKTACNGKTGFSVVNATTVSCEISVGSIGVGTTYQSSINVTANASAFPTYNISGTQIFKFFANCTDSGQNSTGGTDYCVQNSTLKALTATNFWKNPRPELLPMSFENITFRFVSWNQTDPSFDVYVPTYTYSNEAGRPILSNNTYADIMYYDKAAYNRPNFIRMWSYNLTFSLIFDKENANFSYVIRPPTNDTGKAKGQVMIPIYVRTEEVRDPMSNETWNTTLAVPGVDMFTVYVNGTKTNNSALLHDYGINITYLISNGIFTISSVGSVNATGINATDITILMTLANVSGTFPDVNITTTSPIYVSEQVIEGFSFMVPPKAGGSVAVNMTINISNALDNYTVQNLRPKFMMPINVTVNTGTQNITHNLTYNMTVSWFNGTAWVNGTANGILNTTECTTMNDTMPGSPTKGDNITICFYQFWVDLSNSSVSYFQTWDPGSTGGRANLSLRMSAVFEFPVLASSDNTPDTAGSTNEYNATLSVAQKGPLNLSSLVPGLNNKTGDITGVSVYIDGVDYTANATIGSLVIDKAVIGSGTHVVRVVYTKKAAAAAGAAAMYPVYNRTSMIWTTMKKDVVNKFLITKKNIGVKEISIEVKNDINNVKITVERLNEKPGTVGDVSDDAYQYIEITAQNLETSDIKSAKVKFNVSKSWLTDNGYTADDVSLRRYANGWQKLTTTRISESSSEIEFEAETPGFSTFAIVAEKAAQAPAPQEAVCGNDVI
ncbi:MAG: PGF-pre-PGF domain-containing protein, partial [Candidatus Thorarchaeota archaeon]